MLVEFRVANFRSIRDEAVISFVASTDRSLLDNTVPVQGERLRINKTAVIYGANASGKSNLLRALNFMKQAVTRTGPPSDSLAKAVDPFFLDVSSSSMPTLFEVTFIQDSVRYQFGFQVDHERIQEEWLIAYPKGVPQRWYHRRFESDSRSYDWHFSPTHLKGEKKALASLTREDSLFLSTAAEFAHDQLTTVYGWFKDKVRVISSANVLNRQFTARLALTESNRAKILSLIKTADSGISDIHILEKKEDNLPLFRDEEIIERPKQYRIITVHDNKEMHTVAEFDISRESQGTQRLFSISGPILDVIEGGKILIIDELDSSLHPLLTRRIVQLFHDESFNTNNAQLLFVTHDTTLLDQKQFRRDQIWFAEKGVDCVSSYRSLLDFHPRKDEAIQRGYLSGRYGGIPFFETFDSSQAPNA